jgi:uncharacterized membrane protein YheB (UPF0754 family)
MDFLDQIAAYWKVNQSWLELIIMPFVYGFAGWLTNWQAVKMIFVPLHFWGIPPYLGWQGIIPRKAVKFATRTADYLTSKLIHLDELFDRLDPRQMARMMQDDIDDLVEDIVNDVFERSNPLVWRIMPDMAKDEIIHVARNQAPKAMRMVIKDIQKNIFEVFDLTDLAIKTMAGPNVGRMVNLVKTVGKKEFHFIEVSGFYFGFILGLIQVGLWLIAPWYWMVPVQGAIVGYFTNWTAIKMIFRPLHETRYLFFKYQGLFIRRRDEVVREFSKLVAAEILNAPNIIKQILEGRARERIYLIIRMAISQAIDRMTTMVKPAILSTLKSDMLDMVKHEITEELTRPEVTKSLEEYVQQALDVEQLIIDKFAELTEEEYENLLRPIFQEDEFILIVIGGVLGLAVGFFQLWLMLD